MTVWTKTVPMVVRMKCLQSMTSPRRNMTLMTSPVLSRYMISYLCTCISSAPCMLWLSSSLNWSARYVSYIVITSSSLNWSARLCLSAIARFTTMLHTHTTSDVSISPCMLFINTPLDSCAITVRSLPCSNCPSFCKASSISFIPASFFKNISSRT
jgi:hypothetical protein